MTETENSIFYIHRGDLFISVEIGLFLLLIIILSSDLGCVIPRHFRHSSGRGDKSGAKFEKIGSIYLLGLLMQLHYFHYPINKTMKKEGITNGKLDAFFASS